MYLVIDFNKRQSWQMFREPTDDELNHPDIRFYKTDCGFFEESHISLSGWSEIPVVEYTDKTLKELINVFS